MSSANNVSGQAYSLTVLAPISDGHEAELARYLDGLQSGDSSPLARVRGTHFARWVVIDDVVYEGPDEGDREHLQHARLLFTSNFDGRLDSYLEALRAGLGDSADTIWGHCIGYPGASDAGAFGEYFRHHQIDSSLFFAAYGDRTVEDVKRSLAVRTKFIELRASGAGPAGARLEDRLPGGVPRMTDLDLDRIQGFVVRGYRLPLAGYIFLRIDDPARAAAWIAEITNDVLTAAPWSAKPDSGVNIAFSYAGLSALAAAERRRSPAFRKSSARGWPRARACSVTRVTTRLRTGKRRWAVEDVHILVMISAVHQQALSAHDQRIRESIEQAGGLTTISDEIGNALPGNREHFGFADGFAQPDIEGAALVPARRWRTAARRQVAAYPGRRVHLRLSRRGERPAAGADTGRARH